MHRYKKAVDGIHVPDELKQKVLQQAEQTAKPAKSIKGTASGYRLWRWQPVAVAACLVVLLVGGAIGLIRGLQDSQSANPETNNAPPPPVAASNEAPSNMPTSAPQGDSSNDVETAPYTAVALNTVSYPTMVQHPNKADYSDDQTGYDAYLEDLHTWQENIEELSSGQDYTEPLSGFLFSTTQEFLSQTEGQNTVYSPLNLYMALSMLAETTAGDSQAELLNLLGTLNLEELRELTKGLWLTNYRADGQTDAVLANSLWLNETLQGKYNESTLQTLAEDHYASLFEGPAGDPAYDAALQAWLNNQTHGLLQDYTDGLSMPEDLTIGLASAIYFRANWSIPFEESETTPDIFHTPTGDIQTDFMHAARSMEYTRGSNFSSVSLQYEDTDYSMLLMLPDEGISTADLLADPDAMSYLLGSSIPSSIQSQESEVVLSLPKFDVSSQLDLQKGLQALRVSAIFDPDTADFSSLTDTPEAFVDQCIHAARVIANETQTEAAAFTWITAPGAAPEQGTPIVLTLDRPFLFSILGPAGVPLFVGTVCNPSNS